MKVLIDADGCPVTSIAVKLCKEFSIPCLIICDTAHEFHLEGARTVTADQGADSVDFMIINRAESGDLVITQDYGLASMCLARKVTVIHQDGWQYTADNIDGLLMDRHNARKLRASGIRMKGPKKRTNHQNEAFETALWALLQKSVQG